MPMSRAERAARLAQLREQVAALSEEIARLERDDDQFTAYLERAQGAARAALSYPDFARYYSAYEQLEHAWTTAGRPREWAQLPLLSRLRDVLLVPAPAAPTPAPAASDDGRPPAAVSPEPEPPPARAPRTPAARPAGTAGRGQPTAPRPGARAASPAHPGLAEQHMPIVNEILELVKRAEEEFRLAQIANGVMSAERAVYLVERVYRPPLAVSQRVYKVVDDVLRGTQIPDADRPRVEQARDRVQRIIDEAGNGG